MSCLQWGPRLRFCSLLHITAAAPLRKNVLPHDMNTHSEFVEEDDIDYDLDSEQAPMNERPNKRAKSTFLECGRRHDPCPRHTPETNSLEEPQKIVPRAEKANSFSPNFTREVARIPSR